MKISTCSYSLPAFDGKIILRLTLDKTAERGSRVLDYLNDYSCKIEDFARLKLFPRLEEVYEQSYRINQKNPPYIYSFKIICTYEEADLCSYLLLSRLFQGHLHLASNADSLIARSDCFIPPKLICKRTVPNSVLILDGDGCPSWANATDNGITYTRAAKCSSIIS